MTTTHIPNPLWKPGDPIHSPVDQMTTLNPQEIGPKATYRLLIGSIVPRPIAFVSTLSPAGIGNLAPFSFFNGVSSNPPAVMIAITRNPGGQKKDTLVNIETTKEFVVNSVNEWLVEPMNLCSANFPYGVDEMKKVGLTPVPSQTVQPPRVKESAIQFECELYQTLEVGDGSEGSSTIVVGIIRMIHIFDQAYRDGKILLDELKPIARLAGTSYGKISGVFDLPRPK
jgi:flavin reductase (DIM6/NTAB) family NADH-FMN oxidoreductase RutF